MKLIKCGKCGAQFDATSMRAGSTFACGKCRSPVQVPADAAPATVALSPDQMKKALEEARAASAPASAAPAAAKAMPKLPPAMQARAKAESASAPTRAAGAAPAPSAPPVAVQTAPAPAAKGSRRPVGPAPDKKSPIALYASIGGIVVLGIVVFALMSGGDKKEPQKAPEAPKPVAPPAPPPKPKDPNVHDDFLGMSTTEQHDSLVSRVISAGSDLTQLKSLYDWLSNPKVAQNSEVKTATGRVVTAALAADGNCDWAHEAKGDRKIRELLQDCRDKCTKAFQMQDPDEKAILDRIKALDANPWADGAEFSKYSDIAKRICDRDARMKADPRYLESEKKANWVRENPMFKGVELTRLFADPYVVFQEVKKQDERDTKRVVNDKTGFVTEEPIDGTVNPSKHNQNLEWAKKGELFAKRDGIIFGELNRRFRELFAAEYKLPELKEKDRILTGLVMWNRTSFDKLLVEAGQTVSPNIRAFYSPPQQKIFHYIGDEALQGGDEIHCADGYVQKQSDQVTFHEGTHQLQHEYSAIYQGTPLVDGDTKVADRKAMWFEEGIAEFMGATEVEATKTEFLEDVKWRHNRILLDRIAESRENRQWVELWRIKDFLKPNHNGELATDGEKLAPGRGGNMGSHFYCRVWAFCHFLWYYDNGKYRPQFLDYFKAVLAGTQSSAKFAKIMKRPNMNDWGPIEKEYEWYWHALLLRKVGRNKITKEWETPSTEAPTGKVEDDADFCEAWDELHKNDKTEKPK